VDRLVLRLVRWYCLGQERGRACCAETGSNLAGHETVAQAQGGLRDAAVTAPIRWRTA
jgi:hypothetical protein